MIDMPVDRLHPHLLKGYTYMEFEMVVEAEKGLKHIDGGQIDGQEIIAPLTGCLHNVVTHPIPHKEKVSVTTETLSGSPQNSLAPPVADATAHAPARTPPGRAAWNP
ncbi:RNA-binding protein with serine-rich domain 1-like [Oncorhynchus nerka]|uniref:RNA-binding protein with serine-rich domain 1-like n=1 Tax=Oncorhynchus nerka TaxID=8023 RepID=UPI0031B80640